MLYVTLLNFAQVMKLQTLIFYPKAEVALQFLTFCHVKYISSDISSDYSFVGLNPGFVTMWDTHLGCPDMTYF